MYIVSFLVLAGSQSPASEQRSSLYVKTLAQIAPGCHSYCQLTLESCLPGHVGTTLGKAAFFTLDCIYFLIHHDMTRQHLPSSEGPLVYEKPKFNFEKSIY